MEKKFTPEEESYCEEHFDEISDVICKHIQQKLDEGKEPKKEDHVIPPEEPITNDE